MVAQSWPKGVPKGVTTVRPQRRPRGWPKCAPNVPKAGPRASCGLHLRHLGGIRGGIRKHKKNCMFFNVLSFGRHLGGLWAQFWAEFGAALWAFTIGRRLGGLWAEFGAALWSAFGAAFWAALWAAWAAFGRHVDTPFRAVPFSCVRCRRARLRHFGPSFGAVRAAATVLQAYCTLHTPASVLSGFSQAQAELPGCLLLCCLAVVLIPAPGQ